MDHTLRCNSLKCRKELNDHAVVTTCCHIFCIECSRQLQNQLSGPRNGQSVICPGCDAPLSNPDDAVVTNLHPTEDYKTSVLSGLSPNIIMECASRAMNFWAYQATQEIIYQEYLTKNLTDRYSTVNSELDKIVHDANTEIGNLRNKMSNMQIDQDRLSQKNSDLNSAIHEYKRRAMHTQELYDKLKRRAMIGQVQNAALDAVESTIQASAAAHRYEDKTDNRNQHPLPPPIFPSQQDTSSQQHNNMSMGPPSINAQASGGGNWPGYRGQGVMQNQPAQTPSTHRQRLGSGMALSPAFNKNMPPPNGISQTPRLHQRTSPRQPLGPMTGNISSTNGFAGYGMSAGLKVSNPPGSVVNGMARPVIRSRATQRPPSTFAGRVGPNFGSTQSVNMFSNEGNYN